MQCMQQGNKNPLEKHACLLLLLLLHAMRKAASDRQQSEMALFPLPSGGGDAAEKKARASVQVEVYLHTRFGETTFPSLVLSYVPRVYTFASATCHKNSLKVVKG